jgi:hypothetical protein
LSSVTVDASCGIWYRRRVRATLASISAILVIACHSGAKLPPAPEAACTLPADRAARAQWIHDGVATAVASFEAAHVDGDDVRCPPADGSMAMTVHDVGDYALARLALGDDPHARARAESALRCLFSYQTFDAAGGPAQGQFPFHLGDAARLADNSTEFALSPVGAIADLGGLSPALSTGLVPRVEAGLDAIETHHVCPAYTNICWMQIAELLGLGRWLAAQPDPAVAAYGRARVASARARLDEWVRSTRQVGITEFDSPTYSEVDLEVMLLADRAAGDAATRASVRAALDDLWTDLAASTGPNGNLAGPLSRDYDFLTGDGGVEVSLYREGVRSALPSQAADLTKAVLLVDEAAADRYRPPAGALCLARRFPREVRSTFGAGVGRERTLFVAADFTLGSTSADYSTSRTSDQDQMIRAQVGTSPRTPAIAVIPDYLDHPGTKVQAGDFSKVTHLLMRPASAQAGRALLTLLDVDAGPPAYVDRHGAPLPLVDLATNVTFPATADQLALDGAPLDPSNDQVVSAHPTLTVRAGGGAVAVRVLDASGLECPRTDGSIEDRTAPELHVRPLAKRDRARDATARLAIYHTLAPPAHSAGCFARVALLVVGAECDGPRCVADLTDEVTRAATSIAWDPATGEWDVRASLAGTPTLHVRRRVGRDARVLAREVGGVAPSFPPLAVDGTAIRLAP